MSSRSLRVLKMAAQVNRHPVGVISSVSKDKVVARLEEFLKRNSVKENLSIHDTLRLKNLYEALKAEVLGDETDSQCQL